MRTTTALAPAHAEEMAVVHRVFRRGFPMVARLVRCTPPGATGRSQVVSEHLDFLLNGLHHHHSGEDENIWPLLLERSALQAALVNRMEAQHETVAGRSTRVRSLLAGWRESATNGEPLAAAIDDLTEALVEHLDAEEAHVVPLIRTHITSEEWDRFGQETFEKFTNAEKLTATGTLEDIATPEEAAWFTSGLPVPIKVMWRLAGKRKYALHRHGARRVARPTPAAVALPCSQPPSRRALPPLQRQDWRLGQRAAGAAAHHPRTSHRHTPHRPRRLHRTRRHLHRHRIGRRGKGRTAVVSQHADQPVGAPRNWRQRAIRRSGPGG